MTIEEQFNAIAREYDANRRKFIPCFQDFYENTTKFIASNIAQPKRALDLGAGTGLLTYFWYKEFPTSEYVLTDVADEMLEVARERFKGINSITFQQSDYSKGLPGQEFDVILSALSVHHLEHADKRRLFQTIYEKLPAGGLFVNYDQFCAGTDEMNRWFDGYWESQLVSGGLTRHDIELWKERRKLDRECSVEEEAEMLSACRFKIVKCVYSCQKFAVITAIK